MTVRLATAYVDCVCGTPHTSIWNPSYGWGCRYARGGVRHRDSGIIIRKHDCHLCNCNFALPADTPPEQRICDNCGGPAAPTGDIVGDMFVASFTEQIS